MNKKRQQILGRAFSLILAAIIFTTGTNLPTFYATTTIVPELDAGGEDTDFIDEITGENQDDEPLVEDPVGEETQQQEHISSGENENIASDTNEDGGSVMEAPTGPFAADTFDLLQATLEGDYYFYLQVGERLAIEWTNNFKVDKKTPTSIYTFTSPQNSGVATIRKELQSSKSTEDNTNHTFFGGKANVSGSDYSNGANKFKINDPNHWYTVPVTGVYAFNIKNGAGTDQKEFKIRIKNQRGDMITGRTWTEKHKTRQTLEGNDQLDFIYYTQTIDGYKYRIQIDGQNGGTGAFSSNSVGLVRPGDVHCAPVYESWTDENSSKPLGYENVLTLDKSVDCKDVYNVGKLFFNMPDYAVLPENITLPNGKEDWLNRPFSSIGIDEVGVGKNDLLTQASTFDIVIENFEGPFDVILDLNNDGKFDNNVNSPDMIIPASYAFGTPMQIHWDGKDKAGNSIYNYQEVTAQIMINRSGEIHFVAEDLEQRRSFVVERLNGQESLTAGSKNKIFWNDTFIQDVVKQSKCPSLGPANTSKEGADSSKVTHGWEKMSNSGKNVCDYKTSAGKYVDAEKAGFPSGHSGISFGDVMYVHDWTYEKFEEPIVKEFTIPAINPNFTINKGVTDATGDAVLVENEAFTYTIEVQNTGNALAEKVSVQDQLDEVKAYAVLNNAMLEVFRNDIKQNDISYTVANLMGAGITFKNVYPASIQADAIRIVLTVVADERVNSIESPYKISNTAKVFWQVTEKNAEGATVKVPKEASVTAEIHAGTEQFNITKKVSDKHAESANDIISEGEPITYEIAVSNTGLPTKYNMLIKDELMDVLAYIQEQDTLSDVTVAHTLTHKDGGAITSQIHTTTPLTLADLVAGISLDLAGNETISLEFTVTALDTFTTLAIEELVNTAYANEKSDSAAIQIGAVHLSKSKNAVDADMDGFIAEGEAITYTLTANNTGNIVAKQILFRDELTHVLPYILEKKEDVHVTITNGLNAISGSTTTDFTLEHLMNGITVDVGANTEVTLQFTVTSLDTLDVASLPDLDGDGIKELLNQGIIGDTPVEKELPYNHPELIVSKAVSDSLPLGVTDKKAQPGEVLTYTIDVENIGKATSYATIIKDTLASLNPYVQDFNKNVVTMTSSDITSSNHNKKYTVAHLQKGIQTDIAVAEKISITFDVTVKSILGIEAKELINTVYVTNKDGQAVEDTAKISTVAPKLTMDKSVTDTSGDETVQPGEAFEYDIVVKNVGDATSYQTIIQDTLANVLEHVEDTSTVQVAVLSTMQNTATGTYKITDVTTGKIIVDIKENEQITVRFTVVADAALNVESITKIDNVATARTVLESVEDSATIATGTSILTGAKTAAIDGVLQAPGDTIVPGERVTFTITAENKGTVADNVTIQDDLSAMQNQFMFADDLSAIPLQVTIITGDTTIQLPEYTNLTQLVDPELITVVLPAGAKASVTFTLQTLVTIDVSVLAELQNTAIITSLDYGTEIKPSTKLPFEKPILAINKAVVDSLPATAVDNLVQPGENLHYTVQVSNIGKAVSFGTHIHDDFSQFVEYLANGYAALPVTIERAVAGSITTEEKTIADIMTLDASMGIVYNMQPQEVITIKYTLKIADAADFSDATIPKLKNIVSAKNKLETVMDTVEIKTATPRLVAQKAASDANKDGYIEPGEALTYTLAVENTGTVTSYDKIVQDTLAEILPFIHTPTDQKVTVSTNGVENAESYTVAELMTGIPYTIHAGEQVEFVFSVVLKADVDLATIADANGNVGIIRNMAYIEKAIPENPSTSTPSGQPRIHGSKGVTDTDGDGKAQPGELLTYTIAAWNEGSIAKRGVIIQDTLSELLAYIDNPRANVVEITRNDTKFKTLTVQDLLDGITLDIATTDQYVLTFVVKLRTDLTVDEITLEQDEHKVLVNTALIDGTPQDADIPFGKPILGLTKAVEDASQDQVVEAGEAFTYTISITNSGDAIAKQIQVQDTLAQILPYISDELSKTELSVTGGANHSEKLPTTVDKLTTGILLDIATGETVDFTFTVHADTMLEVANVPDYSSPADGHGDMYNKATATNTVTAEEVEAVAIISVGKATITAEKTVRDTTQDAIITEGESFTYTITANNTGLVAAQNILIQDTLINIISHIKEADILATVVVSIYENNGTTPIAVTTLEELVAGIRTTIPAQTTYKFVFTVIANDDLILDDIEDVDQSGDKLFINKATVDTEEPETPIKVRAPKIITAKDATTSNMDTSIVSPTDMITYTLSAHNIGNWSTSEGILFKDELADILPFIEEGSAPEQLQVMMTTFAADGLVENEQAYTLADLIAGITSPQIAPGNYITVVFTVQLRAEIELETLPKNADGSYVLRNIAHIDTTTPEKELEVFTPVLAASKEIIETESEGVLTPGETFSYVLKVTNTGNATGTDIGIKDTMEHILSYIEFGNTPEKISVTVSGGQQITPTITTLADVIVGFTVDVAAGTEMSITIPVTVRADLHADEIITVDVDGQPIFINVLEIEGVPTPPEVTIPFKAPKIIIDKAVLDENENTLAEQSEKLTYTITVRNTGNDEAKQVFIQDTATALLPIIVSGKTPSAIAVEVQGGANNSLDGKHPTLQDVINGFTTDIAVQEEVTISFVVEVLKDFALVDLAVDSESGSPYIANTATAQPEVGEPVESTVSIPAVKPNITASKSATDANADGFIQPGEQITYTIHFENNGSGTAYAVHIQDDLQHILPYITEREITDTVPVVINSDNLELQAKVQSVNDLQDGVYIDIPAGEKSSIQFSVSILETADISLLEDIDGDGYADLYNIAIIGEDTPSVVFPTTTEKIIGTKDVTDANGDGIAQEGEALTYTITAQNIGDIDAGAVFIQDTLEQVLPYIIEEPNLATTPIHVTGGHFTTGRPESLDDLLHGFTFKLMTDELVTITFTVVLRSDLIVADLPTDVDGRPCIVNSALVGKTTPKITIPVEKTAKPSLPITGERVSELILFGATMVVVGTGLALYARRKRD